LALETPLRATSTIAAAAEAPDVSTTAITASKMMRISFEASTWGLIILNIEIGRDSIKYPAAMALAMTKYLHTI